MGLLQTFMRWARAQQSAIRAQDLARNIGSGVILAFSDLERSTQQLLMAIQAANLYRQAVENEREKLRIGTSTIINVITLGDRLSASLLSEIGGKARYANALVRLRFETGLLAPASSVPTRRTGPISIQTTLKPEDFVTTPAPELLSSTPAIP